MNQSPTCFDTLLDTGRELALTVVSGPLGPPLDGQMWIGGQSLDGILCPKDVARQVVVLIAPGGPGTTFIRRGQGTLATADIRRLILDAAASGGHMYTGRLAVLTPAIWLTRHPSECPDSDAQTTLAAAIAVGWPVNCGDYPVLFLDDQSLFSLLAQMSVGRTVTLLVGTVAEPTVTHD